MKNKSIYCVYWNQADGACPLMYSFFCLSNFQLLICFSNLESDFTAVNNTKSTTDKTDPKLTLHHMGEMFIGQLLR